MKCSECGSEPRGGHVRIRDRVWCVSVVGCMKASYEAEKASGEDRVYVPREKVLNLRPVPSKPSSHQ